MAKGEFPGQRRRGLTNVLTAGEQNAPEGAIDVAASGCNRRSNDADAAAGVPGQQIARPRRAGSDFVALVVAGDPAAVGVLRGKRRFGAEIGDGDAMGFEGGEEIALGRCDAIEADQRDFGRKRDAGAGVESRGEGRLQQAGAEPSLARAGTLEVFGPVAEVFGVVLIPGRSPRGMCVAGRKQRPRLHGERSHGLGRDYKAGIFALSTLPEDLLLQGSEKHRSIGRDEGVVEPQVVEPVVPILNRGCGPDRLPGGPLICGVTETKGARSTRTGGDNCGAAPERIDNRAGERHREVYQSVNWRVKRLRGLISTAAVLAVVVFFAGCRSGAKSGVGAQPGSQPAAKKYHIRGIVVSSEVKTGSVTVDTEAIPGYMDAMTMPYTLAQPNIAGELHPGDTITATLTASADADVLDEIVVVAQAKPDYKPAVSYNDLEPGEAVPDFAFRNQNGRTVHLAEWHGKVVLLTFIYTRCPLPNFCVRMSRNFAEIDKVLKKDPRLFARTHLLSVSFDPKYDTPNVLRSYGGAYTGNYTKETFTHWDFAAPPEKELPKVLQFFDVGVTPEPDHTITHSLSTVVIAPDGKLYKWYPGNDWNPQQVLADVEKLAAGKA